MFLDPPSLGISVALHCGGPGGGGGEDLGLGMDVLWNYIIIRCKHPTKIETPVHALFALFPPFAAFVKEITAGVNIISKPKPYMA